MSNENKTFQKNPQDINDLKTSITKLITGVTIANLKEVARNVLKRATSCVNANNGGLFEILGCVLKKTLYKKKYVTLRCFDLVVLHYKVK